MLVDNMQIPKRFYLFLISFLFTGWVNAQPVISIVVDEHYDDTKILLEDSLASHGINIQQFLDVGQSIRLRGEDFMPFSIFVLEPTNSILNAIEEDARLASLLPESIVLFERDGQSHIAVLDFELLLADFDISDRTELNLRAHFIKLHNSLGEIGLATRNKNQQTTELPFTLGQIPDEDLEGSMFFYSSIYQDQNMNLVGELELGSTLQTWLCNARIAKVIFENTPQVAVIAPCRIFAYKDTDSVVLGMINPDYVLEVFPELTESDSTVLAFEEMKAMGQTVFFDMGVE